MSKIAIGNDNSSAVVSTDGGVIETYKYLGRDILYPRREIDGKMRGGNHVCAPYFGPGQHPDQSQHGYGRDVQWQVTKQADDSVELVYTKTDSEYAGLEMKLIYTLDSTDLTMSLTATNRGSADARLTPGFHPYFVSPASREIKVGDKVFSTTEVNEAVFYPQASARELVILDDVQLEFLSDELRTLAIWTDRPGEYICIEPTLAGNSYSADIEGSGDQYVAPGQSRVYQWVLRPTTDG